MANDKLKDIAQISNPPVEGVEPSFSNKTYDKTTPLSNVSRPSSEIGAEIELTAEEENLSFNDIRNRPLQQITDNTLVNDIKNENIFKSFDGSGVIEGFDLVEWSGNGLAITRGTCVINGVYVDIKNRVYKGVRLTSSGDIEIIWSLSYLSTTVYVFVKPDGDIVTDTDSNHSDWLMLGRFTTDGSGLYVDGSYVNTIKYIKVPTTAFQVNLKIDSFFETLYGFIAGFTVNSSSGLGDYQVSLQRGTYIYKGIFNDFRYELVGGVKTAKANPLIVDFTSSGGAYPEGDYFYLLVDENGDIFMEDSILPNYLPVAKFQMLSNTFVLVEDLRTMIGGVEESGTDPVYNKFVSNDLIRRLFAEITSIQGQVFYVQRIKVSAQLNDFLLEAFYNPSQNIATAYLNGLLQHPHVGMTLYDYEITQDSDLQYVLHFDNNVKAGDWITIVYNTELSAIDISNKADKIGNNDIEITDSTKGIILKSPNGTRWRITINNSGSLVATSL